MSLTVLCVTRAEAYAESFLSTMARLAMACSGECVFAVDGREAAYRLEAMELDMPVRVVPVQSSGYLESVLEQAVSACRSDYVLRLDDDEAASPQMAEWLVDGWYRGAPHWKFARAHLWGTPHQYLHTLPLWPDHQTRLSRRELSGGRNTIHAGSPHGGGTLAPVAIEHHKFLVKNHDERLAIMRQYDMISPGAGTAFKHFSVPEDSGLSLEVLPIEHAWAAAAHEAQAEAAWNRSHASL